jgi:hypothetical protein
MISTNTSSYDLPQDVFEPGEKRPVKTKKGKSKGVKKAANTNGSSTPNGVHGGWTPNTRAFKPTLTKADSSISTKKRNLDPEVRQSLMAECTTIQGPLVDYRMLGTRNSSLSWQAIVISQLPAISFRLLSADNSNLGCRNEPRKASTIAKWSHPSHTSRLRLDVPQKVLRHCLFFHLVIFTSGSLPSILVCLKSDTRFCSGGSRAFHSRTPSHTLSDHFMFRWNSLVPNFVSALVQ